MNDLNLFFSFIRGCTQMLVDVWAAEVLRPSAQRNWVILYICRGIGPRTMIISILSRMAVRHSIILHVYTYYGSI